MADQVISRGGLTGLSQSTGGAPSYLDRVLQNQLGGLGGTISTGILATLQNLLANEQLYNQTVTSIGQLVQKAMADLQAAEKKCFADTTHSQQIINANLASTTADVAPKIASSANGVAGLRSIIASMSSPTPPTTAQIGQQVGALGLHPATSAVAGQDSTKAEQDRLQKLTVDIPQFVQNVIAQWQSTPGVPVGCGT
jgi:hypothetical protein